MIRFLRNGHGRGLIPRDLINSIVEWVRGVHSPNGTLRIKNTLSPTESGSVAIDVDVERLYELLRERIAADFVSREDLQAKAFGKT